MLMLYQVLLPLLHLVAWGLVLTGAVLLLGRGRMAGAMPILFGVVIIVLIDLLLLLIVLLVQAGAMKGDASAHLYRIVWIPQLVGMFLFAIGFLQLARATRREA